MTKLLTEKEAAEFLCCSVASLHKWRRHKGGPPIIRFVGRMVRYSMEDLEAFIQTKRVIPGSEPAIRKPIHPDTDYGELLSTDLSVRTVNALVRGDIITLGRLRETPDEVLLRLHGFGRKCLEEVHRVLSSKQRDVDYRMT